MGPVEGLLAMTCFFTLHHSRSVNTFQDEWNTQTLPAAGSHLVAQHHNVVALPHSFPPISYATHQTFNTTHTAQKTISSHTYIRMYVRTYQGYAEQVLTFRAATEDCSELIPLLSKRPAAQIAQ